MNPVGRASNEAIELIIGNVLIALGGIILGLLYPIPGLQGLSSISAAFFGAGIIFDVRVLSKFAYELHAVKDEVNTARRDIQGVMAELRHQERVSIEATVNLNLTIAQIEKQKEELKNIAERTFSRYGSHSRSTPVEEMVERTFEKLDRRIMRLEEKQGTASIRLRGSDRPY